jgi:hypothetical protein
MLLGLVSTFPLVKHLLLRSSGRMDSRLVDLDREGEAAKLTRGAAARRAHSGAG